MTQYLFMSAVNKPQSLQLNNKYISYPYINPNNTTDGVYELLVDIEDEEKTNIFTVSLKCAYSQFYPNYQQYLNENDFHSLDERIRSYYDDIIKTKIVYKYKRGQFGYISLTKASNLEQTFVIIEDLSKCVREISFVHDELEKYKYTHYDITSPKPKILTPPTSGWIIESLFSPIDDTIDTTDEATKDLIQLLNWKICREDYLLKKMMRMKMELGLGANIGSHGFGINANIQRVSTSISSDNNTTTDDDETSYVPASDIDSKSSCYYTSTDNELNISTDITNISNKSYISSSRNGNDEKYHQNILAEYGYVKEEELGYTLKGEIFVAVKTKTKHVESVAIKKMASDGFQIVIDSDLIREALILRDLKTHKLIRNSVVKYTDFFQSQTHCYLVMELNFSINLKEFVITAHQHLKNEKLQLTEYKEIIRYLLWRLTATVHWLHTEMNCSALDICPENIMLSRADFIRHSDDSIAINLQIEMKMVDFGIREMLDICNYHKLSHFKSENNKKYIASENEQYLEPNESTDGRSADMWSFGMVIYYCFLGNYPYNIIPETNDSLYNGYWAVKNGKLKQYLENKNRLKFINPEILSLIDGLLNVDESKRLNIYNVLKHKWFNSFYKTYLSLCPPSNK